MWELDRRPSAPFSWESQGFCHEIGRPMSPAGAAPEFPLPPPPPVRRVTTSRPQHRTNQRFPSSQDGLHRARVRYPAVAAQDAFD